MNISPEQLEPQPLNNPAPDKKTIKCVVWDLDNTLWDGVLLEDNEVCMRSRAADIVKALDSRGILQSIASRNDYDLAMAKLHEFCLSDYFLYPQINWNSKSSSIRRVAESLNIGLGAVALIDDQAFERAEVGFSLPDVLCIDSADLDHLLDLPEMNPPFVSEEMSRRRLMYLSSVRRKEAEDHFEGAKEAFLASLEMRMIISSANEEDLTRAQELTVRTHQLNSTGYTYGHSELKSFIHSETHNLLIVSLDDRYGGYGKIGLALIERSESSHTLKLLLISCRAMATGVGTLLLYHIMGVARNLHARLQAEFIPNDRNRLMYIAYKFAGFKEVERKGDLIILEHPLTKTPPFPDYVNVEIR